MNEPQDSADAGPWLPDPQEPGASASQPPIAPDESANRPRDAGQPASPWLNEPEAPKPEAEGAFEQLCLWCRGNPVFTVVIAAGSFFLVGAIAIGWQLTAARTEHTKARPSQPEQEVPGPGQPSSGPMPVGPEAPRQTVQFQSEVDGLFARHKPFDFDFELVDTDGQPIALANFAGKVLIVDLWGTWCPPCQKEIPHFVALQQKFADAGLVIVGLNSERTPDERQALKLVQIFRQQYAMNYRCALVNEDTLPQITNFNVFPTTMFFDRNGNVRAKVQGYQDYEKLEMIVRKLLDEKIDGAENSLGSGKKSRLSFGMTGFVRRSSFRIAEQHGTQGHYWASSFSPSGQSYMAFGDSGPTGVVRLWDLATGKPLQDLRTERTVWFSNARFLPDAQVVTAYASDKNIHLWDASTGKLVRKFRGHTANGVTVFVSHDGRRLISVGLDNTLRLWNVAEPQAVWTQDVAGEQIASVVFAPDDRSILTSGADRIFRIRELETGAIVGQLEGHSAPCAGEFSPDGKQVLSWGEEGQVRLWDVATAKTLQLFDGRGDAVRKAWLLERGRQVLVWGKDLAFHVWDAAAGRKIREITVAEMIPPGWSEAVVSPDGLRLLVVNSDGDDVRLVDINTGEELYRSERGKLPKARGFSFSPDGRYVAAGSFRTGVYLVQLADSSAESPSQPISEPAEDQP